MSSSVERDERSAAASVARMRPVLLIVGVIAILAGIAALVLPHATLVAVVWVFGVYLLASGVRFVVRGVGPGPLGRRVGLGVLGVLIALGGVLAIVHPPIGLRWLTLLIGMAWLIEGIALLYGAPLAGSEAFGRVLSTVVAIVSIVIGVLVINLPFIGVVVVVAAVGSLLIVFGVLQLVVASDLRPGTE